MNETDARSPYARPVEAWGKPTPPAQPGWTPTPPEPYGLPRYTDPRVTMLLALAEAVSGNASVAAGSGMLGANLANLAGDVLDAVTEMLRITNNTLTHYTNGEAK